MKRLMVFSALALGLLSSCSTAFKSGQTPDDLYYSPGSREAQAAKEARAEEISNNSDKDKYDTYISSSDDQYLHRKVANRQQWNSLDDYSYWNDSRYDFNNYSYNSAYGGYGGYGSSYYSPYSYLNGGYGSYGYGLNSYYGGYNPFSYGSGFGLGLGYYGLYPFFGNSFGWNNPYYTLINYTKPSTGSNAGSNISAFRNKLYGNNNWDPRSGNYSANGRTYNFDNLSKKVYTGPASNPSSSSYDRPTRSYTPPSSSTPVSTSSSAGGSSGGFKSTGTTTSTGRGGKN